MNAAIHSPAQPFAPIDDLEDRLINSYRCVSKADHTFLSLLREFDLRQGYVAYGNTDCAEWLNWKCGISRSTAQEKVRVANMLWGLPQIDAAFARGDLSYSKVRAITRVAHELNETELLAYALHTSAADLDSYCSRLRNGDATDAAQAARRIREGRSLYRYYREDGTGTISVDLPREEIELVMQAIEQVVTHLPKDSTRSLFATAADALVDMARTSLQGKAGDTHHSHHSDAYQVVVHVDATALAGAGGASDLPLPTVKRLCCDGAIVALTENDTALNVGRKQRTVPTAMKRALQARDRSCRFPGCHHERFLDAHHIKHWADGGETSLDNLVLQCTHHHTLLHEGGFSIEYRRDGTYYFVRPDGRPVESECPVESDACSAADDSSSAEVREPEVVYLTRPPLQPTARNVTPWLS